MGEVCRDKTLIIAENFNCREKMLHEETLIGEDFNWWRQLIWDRSLWGENLTYREKNLTDGRKV